MTPRLSGHFSIFGVVFFVLKSLLGIARQWSREKFAILTPKPLSLVRIFDISNLDFCRKTIIERYFFMWIKSYAQNIFETSLELPYKI